MEMQLAALVFVALLMLDWIMGEYQKPRVFTMNEMGVNLLSIAAAFSIRVLPFAGITWLLLRFATPWQGALADVSLWIMLPTVALIDDYGNYWLHRKAHELPWLWRLHKPHHIPEHMNVTMAIRENVFYYLLLPVNILAPLLVFLGAGAAGAIFTAVKLVNTYLQHTSWRWDLWLRRFAFGRLLLNASEKLLAMQDFHHVHHGIGRFGNASSNYGNVMNIFDRLHGTSSGHPHRAQDAYGLPLGVKNDSWAVQLFWPVVREPRATGVTSERLTASSPEALAAAAAIIVTADGLAIAVGQS